MDNQDQVGKVGIKHDQRLYGSAAKPMIHCIRPCYAVPSECYAFTLRFLSLPLPIRMDCHMLKLRIIRITSIIFLVCSWSFAGNASADEVGCVSTTWRVLNNDKVCVQSFKDPRIEGVVCHVSHAQTGGISGALGFAEDPSRFAISCRQVGPIVG